MKKNYLLIFFFTLIVSCSEKSVDPTDDNSFSLQLQVNDTNGNVLPNINVSIWSKFPFSYGLNKLSSLKNVQAATSIRYDIIQRCFIDLSTYSLDGQKKNTLVSGEYESGAYTIQSNWETNNINAAFKVKLIASSDSLKKEILFQDSIYVIFIQPDPTITVVGKTDSNGKLKITNRLLFPHLYNLPSIPITGPDGPEPIGSFTYSDTVTITLTNDSFSKSKSYDKVIKEGTNNYQLDWTTTNSKINFSKLNNDKSKNIMVFKKLSASLINWKLYQNYPNPFN